jgi:predicted ATPase/DNA-binding SARP family transcriptional activator
MAQPPDPTAVRMRLLGTFRVFVGSRTVEESGWRLMKAAGLVKLLALAPDHRLHREQVMEALWPGQGGRMASNSFRQALYIARRTLDPDAAVASRLLDYREEHLTLCPHHLLWVDVEAFEEAASTARKEKEPAAYRAAIDLYAGDLLPADRYEEWAEERRSELRRTYLSLLVELASLCEGRGEYEAAVEALARAVANEPAHERAHLGLMRLYARSGRPAESLRQYEHLEEILTRVLGTHPETETRRLRDDIAAGRFPPDGAGDPAVENGPEKTAWTPRHHNLPAARTSFVGRRHEMLEVKRALAMTRLLTLTGAGGSGKTRLALEVGKDLLGAYPDGVWLVEFAGLSEGTLVSAAVAGVLGVQERAGQPLTDTIGEVLRGKRMLLVLNNCEHLVEEAARLVDTLLDSCPDLRILATSREALGVASEIRWTVPALSVPVPGSPSAVEDLEGYESARLFAERASERRPGFALHSGNAVAVAEICRKLDGIPLAIELSAARTGALAVEEICGRLADSLELLTDGGRTRSPRQRTLRGALDWSYELLGEEERRLFRRLSVFAGGWTLAAAEVVAAGNGLEESAIIELLSQLVDKSLVRIELTGEALRYGFLEPVRQYAREKLGQSGEAESVRRRHAVFFLALAEEAEPELRRREQVAWLRRLDDEHDNLRAVLTWSLDREDAELGLRLAGSLTEFWGVRGHYTDGRWWFEKLLAKGATASTPARAKALLGTGRLMQMQCDDKQAELTTTAGLKLYRELEDRMGISRSLIVLGSVILDQGDLARARPLLEEGLALSHELGDDDTLARGLLSLGWLAWDRGDIERGKSLLEEGLRISRQIGDINRICRGLTALGFAAMIEGNYEWAMALTEEGLALSRESGNRTHTIHLLGNLGTIALE